MKNLATLTIALCFSCIAHAHAVIGISDGDTMTILVDGRPLKIRLANIDAPEKKQPFGRVAKDSLFEMCWGTEALYKAKSVDRYGRTVALVTCGEHIVNLEQIRRGMAWVYKKYNFDPYYSEVQEIAKEKKVGLWADIEPVPPWQFRRKTKTR